MFGRFGIAALAVVFAGTAVAETVIDVTSVGVAKTPVEIHVDNQVFADALRRNLELTGMFSVRPNGAIKVSGAVGGIRAVRDGKVVAMNEVFADDKSARMAARRFSDGICETFKGVKGFACDRILCLNRGQQAAKNTAIPAELCVSYPDGGDIRQLTNDGKMIIFQRWMHGDDILYISDRNGAAQIWQMNVVTGKRSVKWSFKGTPTGIAVSPDGTKVAAVLSFQGNPELYVINITAGNWTRLTNTPYDVEGQPAWSPDGRRLAFVRGVNSQQIWMIDTVTKQERRLTSKGRKNVDPDWGAGDRIAYISGTEVMVMSVATGDKDAKAVAESANWEHPSWACDGRHLTASRDKALFLIDTEEGGDKPRQVFRANGNWTAPCWER